MRLLIITQAVDQNDTTLGFFCSWIREFSKRVEKVNVICLRKGHYDLPKNVAVFSLGKEKGNSKIQYILTFYKYIWKLRHEYDVVFVHMNQEYLSLGGLLWRLTGKKIFFWRNHPHGDFLTRMAVFFSQSVFYTSSHSFTSRYTKAHAMPVGIDTELFSKNSNVSREKNSLLMLGRIAPIKHIEIAIDALAELKVKGILATLSVVGDALSKDEGYVQTLKDRADIAGVANQIRFEKGISFEQVSALYQSAEVVLNFTPSGSFDKTIIEALACGAKVLVCNDSLKHLLPEGSFTDGTIDDSVKKIEILLNFDDTASVQYTEKSRELVKNQSLDMLMEKLCEHFQK